MKTIIYILLGVMCSLALISIVGFKNVERDSIEGTITLSKQIESTDPPCLQMYYYIEQYADTFDIPVDYAYGIAKAETGYDGPFDWNYSHNKTSPSGAVGPMQIMPATASHVNGFKVKVTTLKNNIQFNVRTSLKLLRNLHDKYGDWKVVFGCYNTGKPIVNKYALRVFNHKCDWHIQ